MRRNKREEKRLEEGRKCKCTELVIRREQNKRSREKEEKSEQNPQYRHTKTNCHHIPNGDVHIIRLGRIESNSDN